MLLAYKLVQSAHSDFVSEDVDVALHQGHWLGQYVETGSNQVNEEHFVVLDDAEDALVVVAGAFGAEVDDDARGRVWFDSADILREAKHVVCIGVQLELGRHVAVVHDVEDAVGFGFDLHLAEVQSLRGQLNVIAQSDSLAVEGKLVAASRRHFKVRTGYYILNLGSVGNSDCIRGIGEQVARVMA